MFGRCVLLLLLFNVGSCAFSRTLHKCQFGLDVIGNSSFPLLIRNSDAIPILPKIVNSKLPLLNVKSPKYYTFVVSQLQNVRINLMNGAVFDKFGCMSPHTRKSSDWLGRKKMLSEEDPGLLTKFKLQQFYPDNVFTSEIIYLGGSLHNKDWQHAVIDFLPLYSLALPFLLRRPNVPVVVGKYIRFFQNLFPFNLSTYIQRDFKFNRLAKSPEAPLFLAKRVIYIDFIDREQSYLQPGAYNRILPFICPNCNWSGEKGNPQTWKNEYPEYRMRVPTTNYQNSMPIAYNFVNQSRPCVVVYLDRSQLMKDSRYIKESGLLNGRQVDNQDILLSTVKRRLNPECEFVVWGCKGFVRDQQLISTATVLMGVHGGHFTNMLFAHPKTHIIEFGRAYTLRQFQNYSHSGWMNARWVFAGMSSVLGHHHWFIEDVKAIDEYLSTKKRPAWSDGNITVDIKQVLDTLHAIGVIGRATI